ncbi:hypothetical protein H6F66_25635 [Trichocoleus sp. FACHB-6]|nr:hypothetical protein [Microcoleus sp. FACHB-831]MBD2065603.1 hypothetical protein [Trichocoleus sp. FACHB-6]
MLIILVARLNEHRIDLPSIGDIEQTVPALDEQPQGLKGFCTAITLSPMPEFQLVCD